MLTTHSLGRAHGISIQGDEDGFELHVTTDQGMYVINVHGVLDDLIADIDKHVRPYLAEAAEAWSTRPVRDDGDGYDPSDPKHPDWHSVHADLWDLRDKGA